MFNYVEGCTAPIYSEESLHALSLKLSSIKMRDVAIPPFKTGQTTLLTL